MRNFIMAIVLVAILLTTTTSPVTAMVRPALGADQPITLLFDWQGEFLTTVNDVCSPWDHVTGGEKVHHPNSWGCDAPKAAGMAVAAKEEVTRGPGATPTMPPPVSKTPEPTPVPPTPEPTPEVTPEPTPTQTPAPKQKGNCGVGNGVDGDTPGCPNGSKDGPGTAPGSPGAKGGNGKP
jgi:outer membrane biosynthesis protein TonB